MRNYIQPIIALQKLLALGRELLPGRRALALLLSLLLYTQLLVPPSLASSPKSVRSGANTGERLTSQSARGGVTRPATATTPATETFGVVLTVLNTTFNKHAGIDYHQQSRNLVVSANSPSGQPNNFELIDDGGTHHVFSNISNLGGALKIATARDDGQGMSLGGFRKGDLFTGTGVPGVVARVAPDGSTVQNPWATLTGEAGLIDGLHVDRTGVFGGDLILVTDAGGVWRVNAAGVATQVATLNTPLAGVTTISDDDARYGPWAGKILVGAKEQGAIYAVDAQGGATSYPLGISPEEIEVVPAHENFFGLDPAEGKLWGAPADAFSNLIGDVLVAQESPGVLTRVRWNGTGFETTQIAQVASWGQITFAPAGVAELRGVKQIYDKLIVVRHAPALNSGRVEGALWQLSGENVSLTGNSAITSDLLVPGKPTVTLNGHPSFGGVIEGFEDSLPMGYALSMSGNASLRYLITRTNPTELETVVPPPAPNGTRDVSVLKEGQGVGDFQTLRNLSLSGKAGAVSVPPGTYGSFSASGRTTLVLGLENATEPATYNLQGLTLSGGSDLRLAGPVVLTVGGGGVALTGSSAGAADNPHRLLLKVAGGEVKVNGNGVLYGVVRAPQSVVNISGNGRLRGTLTCDRLSVSGNGVIQVTENDITPPPVNRPPMADAGPDQTLTLPADTVSLNGTVSDDGLPQNGTLSVNWKMSSGPGTVSFANPATAATTAIFSVPGVYTLKLTASDGQLTRSDSIQVEVVQRNQPPTVNAGVDQTIKLSDSANLSGVITDDALPRGSTVAVKWSASSGPAAVTFTDPNVATTSVSFAAPGIYALKLTADDTEFNVTDEVVITVNSSNQPPTANAGTDQTVTQSSAPPAPTEFRLSTISTGFNSPIGIDYHQPTNQIVMSVNYNGGGQPHNFELVAADGTHSRFSNIRGLTDELKLATARDDGGGMSLGGFRAGELFAGTGVPGVIARVSPDGSTVQNPWVTLPGENGLMRGSLHVDRTGVFGGDLIAVTTNGGVWRITAAGQATQLTSIPTHLEGLSTIPDNPQKYGPWAGKILIGAENQRRFYTVDARGNTAFFDLDIYPEDIDLIPENENFFGVDFGSNRLMGAPASAFRDMVGDLLVAQESGPLYRVHWNGTEFKKTTLATVFQWEHVTFAPAGIVEVAPVGTTVTLNGTVTDDAAPGFPLTVAWTKASGPGPVSFRSANQTVTTATFSQPGTYVLRLTASDTEFSSSDEVTVVILPASRGRSYTRNADFDEGGFINVTHAVPDQLQLDETGSAVSGAPDQGTWSAVFDSQIAGAMWGHIGWTARVCGDGMVTISVASSEDGTTFSQPSTVANGEDPEVPGGRFLKVTVSFGRASSGESPILYDLSVGTVDFHLETPANLAPDVDAGTNQTIEGVTKTTLRGAACDDGLPSNHRLTLAWSKVSGPGAVTFARPDSAATAVTFGVPGTYELKLTAGDSAFTRSDTVVVEVVPTNEPPVASAGPDQSVTHPEAATLNGSVTDDGLPRGSTLVATWSKVSGPGGVTFNDPNAASTDARFGAPGTYVLRLTASDTKLAHQDELTVTVGGENQSPLANAGPDRTVLLANNATLDGTASDDGWPEGHPLTVSWSKVSGPGTVTFQNPNQAATTVSFSAEGSYVLRLTADDSLRSTSDEVNVTVNPDVAPPVVSLSGLPDGAEVTTHFNVTGTVSAGSNWKLEYTLGDGSLATSWTTLVSGNTPVTNGTLGVFDPTLLLNGTYTLRLVATDVVAQTSMVSVSLIVSGQQKIGNFSLSFTDLSVPVAGLPIEVTRTYNSRDKRVGDFGVGWTLGVKNIRVEKSGVLGAAWEQTQSGGFLPTYCLRAMKPRFVTITFPDGKVYKFRTITSPQCSVLTPIESTAVGFVSLPGTQGSLAAIGENDTLVFGDATGPVELRNFGNLELYNPTLFQLTTEDGTIIVLDQALGVRSIADPNGNILTVNADGITHSSGKSIVFTRDTQGRITGITDPAGNVMTYSYDANGDLVRFADRENNNSAFTYNATHGLLTITDPRGIQPLHNEYDEGRLVRQTDAFGKSVDFDHDLNARREIVVDRLGHSSIYEYDAAGNVVRTTDAGGNVTARTYDANNNLLSETDPNGKTKAYTYDAQDNLTSETDPLGNTRSYTLNSRGDVLTETDPLGKVTTNSYDARGNLLSTQDSLGNTTSYAYNARGLPATMTDAQGNVTTYEYDGAGNITKEANPIGNVVTYSYDANGNCLSTTTTRTTAAGTVETLVTQFQYDRLGHLVKTIYPDNSTTETVYNENGQQSVAIDQLGRRTSYEYNDAGKVIRATFPNGTKEESAYDAEGRRVKSVDRAGRETLFAYDALGRLEKTTYPDGSIITNTHDAIGRLTAVKDARGNVTHYEYDVAGRRTKIIDALGNVTAFTFDGGGKELSMTDARGNIRKYEYDAVGRRVKVIFPDNTSETTGYDSLGRMTAKTDQAGLTTRYEYDNLGRLLKVTDALGQATRFAHDEHDNLVSQTDARNHTTRFEYDKLGRRTKRTLALGMSETFTFDAQGRLASRTDFNGKTTSYAYDASDRLTTKTPDVSLGQPTVRFTYTASGKRASMTDASGTTTYTYENRDRLTKKVSPHGTLSYTYDAAGNLSGITSSTSNGLAVSYTYDASNRLSTVTDHRLATGGTSYTYDAAGNLQGYLYPNGVETVHSFDGLNRLTNLTVSKGVTIASYTYTLGAAGNRLSSAEHSGRTVSYTYDALYRLTSESIANDAQGSNNGSIGYSYDAVGNRLTRTSTVHAVGAQTFAYDANDRLTTETYDANGNVKGAGGSSYSYDFENRLSNVNDGSASYIYDGDGNRVAKTVGGVTTTYLVDTNNLTGHPQVVEEAVNGSVLVVYTYGHDLISQNRLVAGDWKASFYIYDGQRSTRFLTDETGTITDAYDYDAFGNLIASSGTTPNAYLYTGEQYDPNAGFYYLRARYYNQGSGRFATMDTYEGDNFEPPSLHKYLYTENNPVNHVDPSGNASMNIAELQTVAFVWGVELAFFGIPRLFFALDVAVLSLGMLELGIGFVGNSFTNPNIGTNLPVEEYEIGPYNDLRRRAILHNQGGDLIMHHIPQKAPAARLIPGYPVGGPSELAIALRPAEHAPITSLQFRNPVRGYMAPFQFAMRDLRFLRAETQMTMMEMEQLVAAMNVRYPTLFAIVRFRRGK
jgi:RHS repeat-associated protein